ncbi:MAG: plasmid pRiA4b ORF-3 family protein [Clostridiales bacterium]|jgi:hypothetical protein|nr:plasmid pRiA4b ORF-3 family protein [Clostridiales bacterium]
MATQPIYQFYAELDDYTPKIWRRFEVSNDITVARLGYIIQVLFEMTASHLMAIEVPHSKNLLSNWRGKYPNMDEDTFSFLHKKENPIWRYEIPNGELEPFDHIRRDTSVFDATTTRVRHAVNTPKDKLKLNYDFGDDWWVSLKLEKIFTDKSLPGSELPRVLEGAGFGIIEDVGGTIGLEELAKVFKNKKGADYKRFSEWLGITELDMDAFDLEDMNFRLKKIPRIYKQSYEDGLIPTQKSIDLIERKYMRKP